VLASTAAIPSTHRIVKIVQRARTEAHSIRKAQVVRVAQGVDEGPRTKVLPNEEQQIWYHRQSNGYCAVVQGDGHYAMTE
jgi:uncharacterized protein (UPF0248 family)